MFRKIVAVMMILVLIVGLQSQAAAQKDGNRQFPAKVAFMRNGNVWIYENGKEIQVSHSGKAMGPEWSVDGKLLAYVEETAGETPKRSVYVYSVDAKEIVKIYKRASLESTSDPSHEGRSITCGADIARSIIAIPRWQTC